MTADDPLCPTLRRHIARLRREKRNAFESEVKELAAECKQRVKESNAQYVTAHDAAVKSAMNSLRQKDNEQGGSRARCIICIMRLKLTAQLDRASDCLFGHAQVHGRVGWPGNKRL